MEISEKFDELINLIEDIKKQCKEDSLRSFERGREIGHKEGFEEGKLDGETDEKIEIALRMIQNNFCIEDIVKLTKLSFKNVRIISKL